MASEMGELAEDILNNRNFDEEAMAKRKVMLKQELSQIPEHQLRIMNTFPNYPFNNFPYKPDPGECAIFSLYELSTRMFFLLHS